MTDPVAFSTTQKLTYPVIVEQHEGMWSAQVLGWSGYRAEAATRHEALSRLHQLLAARLENVEVVSMTLEAPLVQHPWMPFAGMFEDDPQFDELLAYIAADRQAFDAQDQSA